MDGPSAPPGPYPPPGQAGIPYPPSNDQALYPTDNRPGFGATYPAPPAPTGQGFPQQTRGAPQQNMGYQPQPGYTPAVGGYPGYTSPQGYPQPQGVAYPQHQVGVYNQPQGFPQQRGTAYTQPQGVGFPQHRGGGYTQPQGYQQPGLYTGSSGNTDMAMAAGMGALAGLAGSYLADKTPTMGEMAIGAGVGGAIGLAGSAATSGGAMSALGLAGHDMGDMQNRRRARQAARYGIPIAAMGAGFLTNKAFDRGSGYDSE